MARQKARRGRKQPERRPLDVDAVIAREQHNLDRCKSKRRFDSEEEARAIALYHRTQWGEDSVPYQCEICRGWHFASRKPMDGR